MSTETAELVPPQFQENLKTHNSLLEMSKKFARGILSDASYREAAEFRRTIDNRRKQWALLIKPAVSAAHLAHKQIKDVENVVDRPLAEALAVLDPAIVQWRRQEEEKRRIDQERINRQLREQEEDQRLREAEELEKSGKAEEAEAVLDAPVTAPEVIIPPTTRVEGIQDRTYWSAEVFDIVKLCRAVADGKAPKEAVLPNLTLLNGLARSMKSALNAQWETMGVRAVSRSEIAGGR